MNLNNIYGVCCNCPAMLDDQGRLFTNYKISRDINVDIMKANNINNAHEYRMYLQNNANKLMNNEINRLENSRCKNNNNDRFSVIDYANTNLYIPFENVYNGPLDTEKNYDYIRNFEQDKYSNPLI